MVRFRIVMMMFALATFPGSGFAGTELVQFDVGETNAVQEPAPPPPLDFITQMIPLPEFGPEYLAAWSISIDAETMRYGPSSIAIYLPDQPPDVIRQITWEARSGYVPLGENGRLIPNPAAELSEFSWRWYGKSPQFTVALTMVDGVLAGRIGAPNDVHYDIAPSASGEILGVTNTAFWNTEPLEGESDGASDDKREASTVSQPMTPSGTWDYTCSASLPAGYHNVDVLVMYTPGMLTAYGSVAAVRAASQTALDDANQALRNVGITSYRYNLFGLSAVDTAHSYDSEGIVLALDHLSGIQSTTAPTWCTYPGNSYVAGQRSGQHADIVALARRDATSPPEHSCGYSRTQHRQTTNNCPREVGPGSSPFAYMVFDPGCNADRLNMAHELGHLLGMEHDPRNADLTGALASCPWSFGHRSSDGSTTNRFNFRTIMAYWQAGSGTSGPSGCLSSAGCSQIDAYSDPNLEWDGVDNGSNPPPWGLNPLGTLAGASPVGVATPPPAGRRAARAVDTLQRLAPTVEAFNARPDRIFANGFERK